MKIKNYFLLLVLLLGLNEAGFAQCVTAPNIDFNGGYTNWTFYTGINGPVGSATPTIAWLPPLGGSGYTGTPGSIELTSGGGTDPFGPIPVVAPTPGNVHSLKLGSTNLGGASSKATYSVAVPSGSAYVLTYRFAMVLENTPTGHAALQKPYFKVAAYDAFNNLINCSDYYYNSDNLTGFTPSGVPAPATGVFDVFYKNWQDASINLTGAASPVRIEFIVADCSRTGHFGYVYVDMDCGTFPDLYQPCYPGSTSAMTAPAGYAAYNWYKVGSPWTFLSSGATLPAFTLTAPGAETYAVVMTPHPGLGCVETLYVHINPVATPHILASGTYSFCQGETSPCVPVTGTGTGTLSYTASWGSGTISFADGGCIPVPATLPPGTYTVTLTGFSASACPGTVGGTITVVVKPIPWAWAEEISGHHCEGDILTFCIHAATGTVVQYDGNPCPASFPCVGLSHTMTPFDGGVYCFTVLATAPATALHLVGVYDPVTSCYKDINQPVSVCVAPTPSLATIWGPNPICEGSHNIYTVVGSGLGGGFGTWSVTPPIITITPYSSTPASSLFDVYGVSAGVTAITYTYTNCCKTVSINAMVTVNPLPTASAARVLPFCDPVCPNQSVYIRICGSADALVNYSWVDATGIIHYASVTLPSLTPPSGTACAIISFTPTVEGMAYFSLLDVTKNGCKKQIGVEIPINVSYPKCNMTIIDLAGSPSGPIAPPDPSDPFNLHYPYQYLPCEGDPYKVRIYGYPGVYHIQGPSLPPGFTATIPVGQTHIDIGPYILPSPAPIYSYVIDQIDGCCTRYMEHDQWLCGINVITRGRPNVTLAADNRICAGGMFTLTASSLMGAWSGIETLYWSGPNIINPITGLPGSYLVDAPPVLTPPTFPPSTMGTVVHTAGPLPAGTYTYGVTAVSFPFSVTVPGYPTYSLPGCAAATSIPVTVYPAPDPISGPSAICLYGTALFTDPTPGGTWSSSIPLCASIDPLTGIATAVSVGTVTITYKSQMGCITTKKLTIAAPGKTDPVTLHCGVGGTETLTNPITGGTWTSFDPAIATVDPSSGVVTGISAGTVWITYSAPTGCVFYTLVTVPLLPLEMPEVKCWTSQNMVPPYDWNFGYSTTVTGMTADGYLLILDMGTSTYFTVPIVGFPLTGTGPDEVTAVPPYDAYPWPAYDITHIYLTSLTYKGCKWAASCDAVISRPGRNDDLSASAAVNTPLSIAPNPTAGVITLSGSMEGMATANEARIEIISLLGKTIFTETAPVEKGSIHKKINISDNTANGIYLIKVIAGGESKTLRFTLSR